MAAPEAILPVHAFQSHIKHLVNDQGNLITVITAGTGSGKSTVLPTILAGMTFKMNLRSSAENKIDLSQAIPPVGSINQQYCFSPHNVHFGTSHNSRLVVITSPNKLSAVSVARRVAQMYESINRHNMIPHPQYGYIGYRVGLITDIDCVYDPQHAQIVFITDEAMVRLMIIDPLLLGIRHLILDEIHVRSLYSDVIMSRSRCLVAQGDPIRNQRQRVMQQRYLECHKKYNPEGTILLDSKDSNTNMHIIICSATIDTARFLRFMYNFPMAGTLTHQQESIITGRHQHISGDNFNVNKYYAPLRLIDTAHNEKDDTYITNVLFPTLFRLMATFTSALHHDTLFFVRDRQMVLTVYRLLTVALEQGLTITNIRDKLKQPPTIVKDDITGADVYDCSFIDKTYTVDDFHIVPIHDDLSPIDRDELMDRVNQRAVHLKNIQNMIQEYQRLGKQLQTNPSQSTSIQTQMNEIRNNASVYTKEHSLRRVIYISDAICETSLTLPNVSLVVDTGRVYEERFDVNRRITINEEAYVTLDRADQRSGRSGRTCDGTCVRLYSKEHIDDPERKSMKAQIQRVALNKVVLLLCSMGLNILDLSLIDPPPQRLAIFAIDQLTSYGCIVKNIARAKANMYIITEKGRLILNLPFEPDVSQMLHATRFSTLATYKLPEPAQTDDNNDTTNMNDDTTTNNNNTVDPTLRLLAIAGNSRNLVLMHQITTLFQHNHFKTHATETLQGIQVWLRHPLAQRQPSYRYVYDCFKIIEATQSDLLLLWLTYRLYLGFHLPTCSLFNPIHIHLSLTSDAAMLWYESLLYQRGQANLSDPCLCRQTLCEELSLEQSVLTKTIETIVMTRSSIHYINKDPDDPTTTTNQQSNNSNQSLGVQSQQLPARIIIPQRSSLDNIGPHHQNMITLACGIHQYMTDNVVCEESSLPFTSLSDNTTTTTTTQRPPSSLTIGLNMLLQSLQSSSHDYYNHSTHSNDTNTNIPVLYDNDDDAKHEWINRQHIKRSLSFLSSLISAALFTAIEHRTSVPVARDRYLAGVILSYAWAGKIKANIDPHCTAVYFTDNPSLDFATTTPSVYPLISLTINQSDQKYFITAAHPLHNRELFSPLSIEKLDKVTEEISSSYAPAIVCVGPEVWAAAEIRLAEVQAQDVRQQTEAYEKLLDVNVNAAVQGSDVAAVVENTQKETADINSLLNHQFAWSRFLAPSRWETSTGSIILIQNLQLFCQDSSTHLLDFIRNSTALINRSPSIFLIRGEYDSFRVFIDSKFHCIGLQSLSLLHHQILLNQNNRIIRPLASPRPIYTICDQLYQQNHALTRLLGQQRLILSPAVVQPVPHPSEYVFYAGKRVKQQDELMYTTTNNYISSSSSEEQSNTTLLAQAKLNIEAQFFSWIVSTTQLLDRHFNALAFEAPSSTGRPPQPLLRIESLFAHISHIYDYSTMIVGIPRQHVRDFKAQFANAPVHEFSREDIDSYKDLQKVSVSHKTIQDSIRNNISTPSINNTNGLHPSSIISPRDIVALHHFLASLDHQWDMQQIYESINNTSVQRDQYINSTLNGPYTPDYDQEPIKMMEQYISSSSCSRVETSHITLDPIIPLDLSIDHPQYAQHKQQQKMIIPPRQMHYFLVPTLPLLELCLSKVNTIPYVCSITTRLGLEFDTYRQFVDINNHYKSLLTHRHVPNTPINDNTNTTTPPINIPTHIHLAYYRYIDQARSAYTRHAQTNTALYTTQLPLPVIVPDAQNMISQQSGSLSSLIQSHDLFWDIKSLDTKLPEQFRSQYIAYYYKLMEWRHSHHIRKQDPYGFASHNYSAPTPPIGSFLTVDHFGLTDVLNSIYNDILSANLQVSIPVVYPQHLSTLQSFPILTHITHNSLINATTTTTTSDIQLVTSSSTEKRYPLAVIEQQYVKDTQNPVPIKFLTTIVSPKYIARLTIFNSHMFDLPERLTQTVQKYNVAIESIFTSPVTADNMTEHPFAVHQNKYKDGYKGASLSAFGTKSSQLPQNESHTINFYMTNTPASTSSRFTEILLSGSRSYVDQAVNMLKNATAPTVISTGNIRSEFSVSILRLFNNNHQSNEEYLKNPVIAPYYRSMNTIASACNVIISYELIEPNFLKDSFVHADEMARAKEISETVYDTQTALHLDQVNVLKEGSITIYGLSHDITNAMGQIMKFDTLLKPLRRVYKNISPSVFSQVHSHQKLIHIQREAARVGVFVHLDRSTYYAEILHPHSPELVQEYATKIELQLQLHAGTHLVKERRCCLCSSPQLSSDNALVILNKCGHVICQSCLTGYLVKTITDNITITTSNAAGANKISRSLCCPEARNDKAIDNLIDQAEGHITNLKTILSTVTPPHIDQIDTCCRYPLNAIDLSHSLTYTNWSTILSNCIRRYLAYNETSTIRLDIVPSYGSNNDAEKDVYLAPYFNPDYISGIKQPRSLLGGSSHHNPQIAEDIRSVHKRYVDAHVNCENPSCSILTINHYRYHTCSACQTSYCKQCHVVNDPVHRLLDCQTFTYINTRRAALNAHFQMLVDEQKAFIDYMSLHTHAQLTKNDILHRVNVDNFLLSKAQKWFAEQWQQQYPATKIPTVYSISPAKYNLPSYRRFINGLFFHSNNIKPDPTMQYLSTKKEQVYSNPPALVLQAERQYEMVYKALETGTISWAFHGTRAHLAILRDGLDPSRRSGQAYGAGEYFAPLIDTSRSYSGDTKYPHILICLLLKIDTTHLSFCHVVNNPLDWFSSYVFPIGYFSPVPASDKPLWLPPTQEPTSTLLTESIESSRLNLLIKNKAIVWIPLAKITADPTIVDVHDIASESIAHAADLVPQHHWQFIVNCTQSNTTNNGPTQYMITLPHHVQISLNQHYDQYSKTTRLSSSSPSLHQSLNIIEPCKYGVYTLDYFSKYNVNVELYHPSIIQQPNNTKQHTITFTRLDNDTIKYQFQLVKL